MKQTRASSGVQELSTASSQLNRLLDRQETTLYWQAALDLLQESAGGRAASLRLFGHGAISSDTVIRAGDWSSAALRTRVTAWEQQAEEMVAPDDGDEESLTVLPAAADGWTTIHAPVTVDGQVRGVVSIVLPDATTLDLRAKTQLPAQIQALIGNGLRAQELHYTRAALARADMLYQISQAVTNSLDLTTVLSQTTQIAADALDAEAATLFRIDEQTHELVFMITKGTAATMLEEQRMPIDQGVAGWVATHSEHLIVNDTQGSNLFDSSIDSKTGFSTRNILCVPLKIQNRIVGVLEVLNRRRGQGFTAADADWLGVMAQQVAIALDNAQLYAREQRKVRELATLNRLSHAVSRDLDVSAVLATVTQGALDITGADRSELLLLDSAGRSLVLHASAGYGAANADLMRRVLVDEGIEGWSFTHGQATAVRRAADDRRFVAHHHLAALAQGSVAAAPLSRHGRVVGVVVVYSLAGHVFDREQLELLQTFANQAAVALQNAELYQELRTEQERILSAQEEVRHQLARDLHDNTAQMLSLIIMDLDLARQLLHKARVADAGRELDKIDQIARQANQEVRTLLFELRPIILERRGLIPALEAYHQQLVASMAAEVHLEVQPLDFAMHRQGARVIFGIVQEAINNVRRHAQAQQIWIRIQLQADHLVFEVEDDGVGFDFDTTLSQYPELGSYGLLNMRDQATLLGGNLSFRSPRLNGHGVLLRGVIPIARLRQADS